MAGFVAMAVAVIVEEVFMVSEDRRELIDELIFTRSRLAESEREAGVAAERQRVAHEIHDTVAQGLSSIQMLLYAAERDISDDSSALDRLQVARKVAAENLRVTVVADIPAGLVEMEIVDDGRGFDVSSALGEVSGRAQGGHICLLTMRQRAASIGASVQLESAPGQGTVVRTSAPLDGHRLESHRPHRPASRSAYP